MSPGVHDEEPDLKVVIRDDGDEENDSENIDIHNEAAHIDIGTPWGRLPNADAEVHSPASIPVDCSRPR